MSFIQTVEADAAIALADVKAGLTYLKTEGAIIVAWVEKEVPGSAGAIATFLQGAETAAASLATQAANGLAPQIAAGAQDVETFLANLISATHLGTTAQSGLQAIDVSAVALVESIATGLVKTGLATLLSKLPAAASASTPPMANPVPPL